FRVNGNLAITEDHPEYIDVVKLWLPDPLMPGDSIVISASFHVRLPFNFNGNGYNGHHFEVRNWYPEPAVYDAKGWHPMPFLVQGGAFHEPADYSAEIEAPGMYQLATGSAPDTISRNNSKILTRFLLKNANGFAWIADSRFQIKTDTL